MKSLIAAAAIAAASLLTACNSAATDSAASAERKFKKTFPNMHVDAVKSSEVAGIFEVYAGARLIYYVPAIDGLLFGELFSPDGKSITQGKLDAALTERVHHLDKSKATVVGDGPLEMVSFLDPDCGHCLNAHTWLSQRQGAHIKQFVYLMPRTPDAYARALNLVCTPQEFREAALSEMFNRRGVSAGVSLKCDEGDATLAEHARIAADNGVTGTPVFIVKDQTVLGFQQDRLEALLTLEVSTRSDSYEQ